MILTRLFSNLLRSMIPSSPLKSSGPLSESLLSKNITDFKAATEFICQLPYGRNSNRNDVLLLISENCGTCSSKHAFLKQLAIEQHLESVELILCIYLMNSQNTKGIGKHLIDNHLSAIPEAHCYLRIEGQRYDFTRPGASIQPIEAAILEEKPILPHQVGDFKPRYHRQYMDQWRLKEGISYSLEELWAIRERCIQSLSENQ